MKYAVVDDVFEGKECCFNWLISVIYLGISSGKGIKLDMFFFILTLNPFSLHAISSSCHLRFKRSPWYCQGFRKYNVPRDHFYSSGCKITTSPWIFTKTVFNTTNLQYLTWTAQAISGKTSFFSYRASRAFRADSKYATTFPLSLSEISGNKSAQFVFIHKYKSDPKPTRIWISRVTSENSS